MAQLDDRPTDVERRPEALMASFCPRAARAKQATATSVRKVLLKAGLQPAPHPAHSSWRAFLQAQARSMLACDFLTIETAFLQRIYVLFFISLATRRIEYVACTSNPNGDWVAQQARNLVMQFGDGSQGLISLQESSDP